jgi:hypothetical protein
MVWKTSEWKQAIHELQDSIRSAVEELFEAVASEENRLVRMEMDGRLERTTGGSHRKVIK